MTIELSPLATDILVRRVAQVDAPWLPLRRSERASYVIPGAIWYARRGEVPLSLHATAGDAAQRQRSSRAHGELANAGFIKKGNPRKPEVTAEGLRYGRGLAWPGDLGYFREALDRLAERTAAGDHLTGPRVEGLVPETFIAGTPWTDEGDFRLLWQLDRLMLPALRAGLVESETALGGPVFYRLKDGPVSAEQFAEIVSVEYSELFVDELANLYLQTLKDARSQICDFDPSGELGYLPIPPSLTKSGRKCHDLEGIEPLYPTSEPTTLAG